MKDQTKYLIHIMECLLKIESYAGKDKKAFLESSLIQDAVIRNFEVMGEAAKRITQQTRNTYKEIPWRTIAGLRDVLIHQYEQVNPTEIWQIIEKDFVQLKSKLQQVLNQLDIKIKK